MGRRDILYPNLAFGDLVRIMDYEALYYVIGESVDSTSDHQLIVLANATNKCVILKSSSCHVVASGYHDVARRFQTKYFDAFPGAKLKGYFPQDSNDRR